MQASRKRNHDLRRCVLSFIAISYVRTEAYRTAGQCGLSCKTGFTALPDADNVEKCIDFRKFSPRYSICDVLMPFLTETDFNNCGALGNACKRVANGITTCVGACYRLTLLAVLCLKRNMQPETVVSAARQALQHY